MLPKLVKQKQQDGYDLVNICTHADAGHQDSLKKLNIYADVL